MRAPIRTDRTVALCFLPGRNLPPPCGLISFITLLCDKYGVLRKLKHIFPNTYQRIKSIRSPAKVGLVVTDLITSPVVSWEGWETPPPSTAALLSFFA